MLLLSCFTRVPAGLANNNTLHIDTTPDHSLKVVKPRRKKQQQPKFSKETSVTKGHHSKIAKSIGKEQGQLRPDLKVSFSAAFEAQQCSSDIWCTN